MQYIYNGAKNRRSGTTLQKQKPRGRGNRWHRAREVRNGFPQEMPFVTEEEIVKYLDGDEITCLICGRQLKELGIHLARVHGENVEKYRIRFNIPVKFSLSGRSSRALRAAASKSEANLIRLKKMQNASLEMRETKTWRKRLNVELSNEINTRNLGGVLHKPKYEDFSWHLKIASEVYDYLAVAPPPGLSSWSAYKKRRTKDRGLHEAFKDARARRVKLQIIRPKRASEITGMNGVLSGTS